LLDEKGNQIFEENNYNGFRGIKISKNKKLLAYTYGGICTESDDCGYDNFGLRVIKIPSNEVIDDTDYSTVSHIYGAFSFDDFITTEFQLNSDEYLVRLYDAENDIKYEIHLNKWQKTHLIEFTKKGLIYENRTGINDTLLLENDFVGSNF